MERGKPPIGDDGYPVELHHIKALLDGGSNESSNLVPLTRTEHRGKRTYRKHHPTSDRFEE